MATVALRSAAFEEQDRKNTPLPDDSLALLTWPNLVAFDLFRQLSERERERERERGRERERYIYILHIHQESQDGVLSMEVRH